MILVVLVVLGLGGGYYAYLLMKPSKSTIANNNQNTALTNVPVNTDSNNNVNTPGVVVGTVKWQAAKSVRLAKLYETPANSYNPDATATMAKVGTVTSGTYSGADVIRYSYREDGPIRYDTYYYLLKQGSVLTLLKKSSNQLGIYDGGPQLAANVKVNDTDELPGLWFPDTIDGPKPGQRLKLDGTVNDLFTTKGMSKVFTDPTYGPVYIAEVSSTPSAVDYNNNAAVEAFVNGTAFSTRNGFYLQAPDGTVRVYKLVPAIINGEVDQYTTQGKVPISWTDGGKTTKTNDTYNFTTFGGCGAVNYINAVPAATVSLSNDLEKVGTASNGDAIYQLKDTNSQILKDFYALTVVYDPNATEQKQKAYVDYIASHPVVFWVDPFGRLTEMTNTIFSVQAECGKPVIYLYPPTTTNVDVQLQPRGGFTYTEPAYAGGWHVTAQPNSQLTERATGKTYPYLFWEGRGGLYQEPTKGFVVTQRDVHSFLVSKLARLGLNKAETADFITFWEPRMQGSPYYFVSFLGNRTMDEIAPLTVTPKPDTIIRILMDFHPLSQPIAVRPQTILTPERKGFTVVEWGGVLR